MDQIELNNPEAQSFKSPLHIACVEAFSLDENVSRAGRRRLRRSSAPSKPGVPRRSNDRNSAGLAP